MRESSEPCNDKGLFVPEMFYLVAFAATGLVSYCESHCVRLSATHFGGKEKCVGFQFRCNDTHVIYCIYPVARYACINDLLLIMAIVLKSVNFKAF